MHKRTTPKSLDTPNNCTVTLTPAEAKLWARLRAHRMKDVHFRNQHAIGTYVVDFCAPREKLIIELDGSQHLAQEEYDAERTLYLESQGYRVTVSMYRSINDVTSISLPPGVSYTNRPFRLSFSFGGGQRGKRYGAERGQHNVGAEPHKCLRRLQPRRDCKRDVLKHGLRHDHGPPSLGTLRQRRNDLDVGLDYHHDKQRPAPAASSPTTAGSCAALRRRVDHDRRVGQRGAQAENGGVIVITGAAPRLEAGTPPGVHDERLQLAGPRRRSGAGSTVTTEVSDTRLRRRADHDEQTGQPRRSGGHGRRRHPEWRLGDDVRLRLARALCGRRHRRTAPPLRSARTEFVVSTAGSIGIEASARSEVSAGVERAADRPPLRRPERMRSALRPRLAACRS